MRYEKEMIPIINDYLVSDWGYSEVRNEFRVGYGIADVVAIKKNEINATYPFSNLLEIYLLNDMPLNQPLNLDEIMPLSSFSKNYLKYKILKKYIEAGYLTKENEIYRRIKNLPIPPNRIIAIEAKLKKWKDAFMQAMRYKKYADYCYVTLPEAIISYIEPDLFVKKNIGVLSIDGNNVMRHVIKAKLNDEKDKIFALYANSMFN